MIILKKTLHISFKSCRYIVFFNSINASGIGFAIKYFKRNHHRFLCSVTCRYSGRIKSPKRFLIKENVNGHKYENTKTHKHTSPTTHSHDTHIYV